MSKYDFKNKKYPFDRAVVVVAVHGERYLGFIESTGSPQDYIKAKQKAGEAVCLHAVYIVALNQQVDRQSGKITQNLFLVPPDNLISSNAKELHVAVSSWYFPSEDPASKKKLDVLYDGAIRGEAMAKAAEAGIHIPGAPGRNH